MRKLSLTLFFLFVCCSLLSAQNDFFTIKPGQKATEIVPDSVQYVSSSFVKGRAMLKDGRFGSMYLNYNRLFEEMIFIDDKKDTVSVKNPEDFVFFVIAQDTFVYSNNVYLRKVGTYGKTQLAERAFFVTSNVRRQGPMGTTSTGTASDMINQHESIVGYRDMIFAQYVDLKLKRDYYIAGEDGDFKLATKKNFQKLASNKSKAKEYLKSNAANFLNKEDLEKALSYAQ